MISRCGESIYHRRVGLHVNIRESITFAIGVRIWEWYRQWVSKINSVFVSEPGIRKKKPISLSIPFRSRIKSVRTQ